MLIMLFLFSKLSFLNVENIHGTFLNTKIPFQKRIFYDNGVQNVTHNLLKSQIIGRLNPPYIGSVNRLRFVSHF